MRVAIFSILFMFLIASAVSASGLEITEIDAHVDYDEAYTYRVENRDRIDSASVPVANNTKIDADVLPGSNITFTVRVENTFKGEEPDLRGVFARMTIEEIDDGADLDEESTDFDLEPGDDYRYDVKFLIPVDVDAGTYNVVIEVEGEDRNETQYSTELNLKLEVKKQSHDIRIANVLLNPSVVDCSRKSRLTAEIVNAGSNPESQIALEFRSGNFGINSFDRDISLQSSDEASEEEKTYTKTLNIEVPSFFSAGTYPIFVNLYWKNFVLFDRKAVDLIVKDCAAIAKPEQKREQEEKEEIELITPKEEAEEKSEELVVTTRESPIFNSMSLSVLFGGLAVIIVFILVIVGYLKTRKIQ